MSFEFSKMQCFSIDILPMVQAMSFIKEEIAQVYPGDLALVDAHVGPGSYAGRGPSG